MQVLEIVPSRKSVVTCKDSDSIIDAFNLLIKNKVRQRRRASQPQPTRFPLPSRVLERLTLLTRPLILDFLSFSTKISKIHSDSTLSSNKFEFVVTLSRPNPRIIISHELKRLFFKRQDSVSSRYRRQNRPASRVH